jgi:hypothetical protein
VAPGSPSGSPDADAVDPEGALPAVTLVIDPVSGATGQVPGQYSAYVPAEGGGTQVIDRNGPQASDSTPAVNGANHLLDVNGSQSSATIPTNGGATHIIDQNNSGIGGLAPWTLRFTPPTPPTSGLYGPFDPFGGIRMNPLAGVGMGWNPFAGTNPFGGWNPFTTMSPFMGTGWNPYSTMSPLSGLGMSPFVGWNPFMGAGPLTPWGAGTPTSPNPAWHPTTGMSPSMGPAAPLRPGILAGGSPTEIPLDASPLVSAFISYTQNRTADIAGWEDHSILTRGTGNLNTYDDSNVFIDRTGKINANTGDLDSAGLNAVATVRSTVAAGPHCDDGCDNESVITSQLGAFDEADVAIDGHGNVVMPDVFDSDNIGTPTTGNLPGDVFDEDDIAVRPDGSTFVPGSDDDELEDDSPTDDSPGAPEGAEETFEACEAGPTPSGRNIPCPGEIPQAANSVVDDSVDDADEGTGSDTDEDGAEAVLPPDGSLTVGGDGIDDLSARVDGTGNVATYDDSNVVIGGTGDVNAQIGDADTGGVAVMDTIDSVAHGGNSR